MSRRVVATLLFTATAALTGLQPSDAKEPVAAPIKLSGTGDRASTKFRLQAGLSTWQISHDGRSNFQVSLLSSDGKSTMMPVNTIGRFKGTQAVHVAKAGEYLLNVNADGKWAITIEQPRPATAAEKPLEVMGKGPSVSRFVTLPKGISVFEVSHRGDAIFRVTVLDREGRIVMPVVAVVGKYEGSKAIMIPEEGVYLVNVSANGEWTLKVE
jgi:hypothetical protein